MALPARLAPALLSGVATAIANLVLGFVTLLPAAAALLALSVNAFGMVSTDYGADPGFYGAMGLWSGVAIVVLFVSVNAVLQYVLPLGWGWIWLLALATYPVPYLVDLWSSR